MENFFEREQQIFWKRLFRRIFLEDWLMKLIALVITLGLWLGITGLRPPISRRFTNVPLNLRVSNDLEVTNSPVTEITLIISGDKGKVDQMKQDDLVVSLDLSEVQPGERVGEFVDISADRIVSSGGLGARVHSLQNGNWGLGSFLNPFLGPVERFGRLGVAVHLGQRHAAMGPGQGNARINR